MRKICPFETARDYVSWRMSLVDILERKATLPSLHMKREQN